MTLSSLVDQLTSETPWLDLGEHEDLCRNSDDALDAVIAALTARASALGAVDPIPTEHLRTAAAEGWIALPTGSLENLFG